MQLQCPVWQRPPRALYIRRDSYPWRASTTDTQEFTSKKFDRSSIKHVVLAGWAGRDPEALEAHVRELEALGVPRPTRTPIFNRVSASLLTTKKFIQVLGPETSGEVEFFLVFLADARGPWVGLGSDHTDRGLERMSIALSKQLCAKVVAPMLWNYHDLVPHWDQLVLRSWATDDRGRRLYQEATLATLLPPMQLIDLYQQSIDSRIQPGTALFGGTIAAVDKVAPARRFEMELEDPVLERKLSHAYRVDELPVNS